jgi:hypothetical protein
MSREQARAGREAERAHDTGGRKKRDQKRSRGERGGQWSNRARRSNGGADLRPRQRHRRDYCSGRKPPFLAVKRPARAYKSIIHNRFTTGNAEGA